MNGASDPLFWEVPREWVGERCFIIGGGESVRAQRDLIPQLRGHLIVIKRAVELRPDADVLLLDIGYHALEAVQDYMSPPPSSTSLFTGRYVVVLDTPLPYRPWPAHVKRVVRDPDIVKACCDLDVLGPFIGIAAIALACRFGATEIVLLGFDGVGTHWFQEEDTSLRDTAPSPCPEHDHFPHAFAENARRLGIRIVNTSPITHLTCFERQPLETYLEPPNGDV